MHTTRCASCRCRLGLLLGRLPLHLLGLLIQGGLVVAPSPAGSGGPSSSVPTLLDGIVTVASHHGGFRELVQRVVATPPPGLAKREREADEGRGPPGPSSTSTM